MAIRNYGHIIMGCCLWTVVHNYEHIVLGCRLQTVTCDYEHLVLGCHLQTTIRKCGHPVLVCHLWTTVRKYWHHALVCHLRAIVRKYPSICKGIFGVIYGWPYLAWVSHNRNGRHVERTRCFSPSQNRFSRDGGALSTHSPLPPIGAFPTNILSAYLALVIHY